MTLHQVRKLSTVLNIAAIVIAALVWLISESDPGANALWLCWMAVGLIVANWVVLMKYWRCPGCGAVLPVRQHFYSLHNCPECGKELDLSRW